MKKTISLSIAAAAAAAVVVSQVLAGGPAPRTVSLSVFKRPQTASDRLPAAIAKTALATHFANADSRLVGHYGDATYYAVPGQGHLICLVGTNGPTSFGNCAEASLLEKHVIYYGRQNDQQQVELAALANDGLTRVTYSGGSKRIRHNAFFVTLPRKNMALKVTGPGVATRNVSLPFGPHRRK